MKGLISIFCLIIISSVSIAYSYSSLRAKSFDSPMMRLGDGYLSYDKLALGESALNLADTKVFYSDVQTSVNLNQSIDFQNLAKNLNIDLSASGGWGNYAVNALIDYLNYVKNTDYTENFIFTEKYFVKALLDINKLPADATAFNNVAANLYRQKGTKGFTDRYGDSFITQLPMGVFLITNLKFIFSSALDKQKFDMTLGGNFGSIFNAKVTIGNAVSHSKAKGTIEISAYQLGGDPSELPKIFAKKIGSGYYVTSCDLENWKNCQEAIDNIIQYAQTNLSKQIKSNGSEKPQGSLAVVGPPSFATYSSKFGIEPAPFIDPTIIKNRLILNSIYNENKTNKIFFDHFLNSPVASYFTPGASSLLKDIQSQLNWNLSLFDQFESIRCYIPGREKECESIVNNIQTLIKTIDPKALDFYKNTGFFEDHAQCNYVPVGSPQDENPLYANFCFGQWVKGIFTFALSPDKSRLTITGNYRSLVSGHEISVKSTLSSQGSAQNFSGVASYQDLDDGNKKQGPLAVRLTKNNV